MATLARRLVFVLSAAALVAVPAACNRNSNQTVPTPVQVTEEKTGTVQVGGQDTKTFTVNYAYDYSSASITLKSVTSVATGAAVSTTLGVAFGSIAFDGSCTRASSATATAATIGQTLTTGFIFQASNYCIAVFDAGTLTATGPVNYAVTLTHY